MGLLLGLTPGIFLDYSPNLSVSIENFTSLHVSEGLYYSCYLIFIFTYLFG